MDVKKFSLYTVLGSLPWCFGLAYVGVLLGPHWSDLEALFRYLDIVVIAGIIGLVGYLIYHRERIGAVCANVKTPGDASCGP